MRTDRFFRCSAWRTPVRRTAFGTPERARLLPHSISPSESEIQANVEIWISRRYGSLAACGSDPAFGGQRRQGGQLTNVGRLPPTKRACCSRDFTGVHLRGRAGALVGRSGGFVYIRASDTPHCDTILAVNSTSQPRLGHVGVVKNVWGRGRYC